MEITIGGIGLIILVPMLVQGAKLLGMPDKAAPWLCLFLSLLGALVAEIVVQFPQVEPWVVAIVGGFMVWFASTGIYHITKNVGTSTGIVKD